MPANTRDIKRRTKSVTNTRQITRAMQLVATSKMKKAQKRSQDAHPYAEGALNALQNLTSHFAQNAIHPFWEHNGKSQKIGLILISSDRGFCGGLNVNLFHKILPFVKNQQAQGNEVEVVTVGKKGRDFVRRLGLPVIADFSGLYDHFTISEITPIAHIATTDFVDKVYSKIYLAYTDFINVISQAPMLHQILPIDIEVYQQIAKVGTLSDNGMAGALRSDYIFEPTPEIVFKNLIPYLIEVLVYKAILDSRASEHSARMVAMKNATDRAGEMIADLQLEYNQARQAGITREIAEISAGAMAI